MSMYLYTHYIEQLSRYLQLDVAHLSGVQHTLLQLSEQDLLSISITTANSSKEVQPSPLNLTTEIFEDKNKRPY